MPQSAGIFISYRREGAGYPARSLYERLVRELGGDAVFMDIEGLELGEDFVEILDRQLAQCRVMLALIHPGWAEVQDVHGQPRLHSPHDFVRLEIATALARPGVRVVPVLLDGAAMPDHRLLPEALQPLLRRQALALRLASFDADLKHLAGQLQKLLARGGAAAPSPVPAQPAVPHLIVPKPRWAVDSALDQHGQWADLQVQAVVQRMRWIAPGEFLMGRPANEVGGSDEVPQHRVRITRGFWLADTACTQALWHAMMGSNPSRFQGDDQCPVESVTHMDVEEFLQRLQPACVDDVVALPTEAEWEFACRAGTSTAFSVGATVTPEQVNYDGSRPYAGAKPGLGRGRTVGVKSMPCLGWGLFQMHGNVWEWCEDDCRPYLQLPMGDVLLDPRGPRQKDAGGDRAIRGGAWDLGAVAARSASRGALQRDVRARSLGFRLAVRPQA